MKKILSILICAVIVFSGSVFAEENTAVFHDFKMYTGTVWLLDDEDSSVILKNVRTKNTFGREEIVMELEYTKVPIIAGNVFSAEGEALSVEQVNTYLLDSKVTFIAAQNESGYKVLYMEIE